MSDPIPEAAGAYIRLPKPKSAGWGGKALLVCLLALLMAIPGLFVLGLVHDRANRSEKVVAEVSDMKGGQDMFENGTVLAGNEYIRKALEEVVNRPVPQA